MKDTNTDKDTAKENGTDSIGEEEDGDSILQAISRHYATATTEVTEAGEGAHDGAVAVAGAGDNAPCPFSPTSSDDTGTCDDTTKETLQVKTTVTTTSKGTTASTDIEQGINNNEDDNDDDDDDAILKAICSHYACNSSTTESAEAPVAAASAQSQAAMSTVTTTASAPRSAGREKAHSQPCLYHEYASVGIVACADGDAGHLPLQSQSLPGAYAEASAPMDVSATDTARTASTTATATASTTTNLHPHEQQQQQPERPGMPIARQVLEADLQGTMQRAQPTPRTRTQDTPQQQRRKTALSPWLALLLGVLVVVPVVVVVVVVVSTDFRGDDGTTTTTTPPPSSTPSKDTSDGIKRITVFANSTIPVVAGVPMETQQQVIDLLPAYTRQAMTNTNENNHEGTSSSPQYQAFQWLVQDPHLHTYLHDNSRRNGNDNDNGNDNANWRVYQRLALATFYYATNGHDWARNDRWLSYTDHECTWYFQDYYIMIQLVLSDWRPTPYYLDIEHPNACEWPVLTGKGTAIMNGTSNPNPNMTMPPPVPPSTDDNTLKHFWMFKNNVNGSIPEELYWLTSLQTLALFEEENLGGTLSSRIGDLSSEHFRYLHYSYNALTGSIPLELGQLTNMASLLLMSNDLTGPIPETFGRSWPLPLSNSSASGGASHKMEVLQLDFNHLTGTIPVSLFEMTNLLLLYLYENFFSGSLPSQVGQLGLLHDLFVDGNQLSGTVRGDL